MGNLSEKQFTFALSCKLSMVVGIGNVCKAMMMTWSQLCAPRIWPRPWQLLPQIKHHTNLHPVPKQTTTLRKRRKVSYDKSVVLSVPRKNENWHILTYFDIFWRIRRPQNDETTSGVKILTDLAPGAWRSNDTINLCGYYLNYWIPPSETDALFVSAHLLPHTMTTLLEHVVFAQRLSFSLLLEAVLARGLVCMACISE